LSIWPADGLSSLLPSDWPSPDSQQQQGYFVTSGSWLDKGKMPVRARFIKGKMWLPNWIYS